MTSHHTQALWMRLSFRLMLTVEMLRDFTSVQSDFDITITHSAPEHRALNSPCKSPRICANYTSGPWRSGGATAPFAPY